jgi:poly(hydroxyalkanoate) depolymerase family esterase
MLAGVLDTTARGDDRGGIGTVQHSRLGSREYRLFVPSGAGDDALPLVVALHGCWQTPDDFARGTRLDEAGEARRLVVVYPAQSRRDNVSRCWNWFDPAQQSRDRGETGEILGIVQHVKARRPVRSDAVIVIGFSAGGFMAVNLVCATPETWAGVGVAAGGPYRCGVGVDGALTCMQGRHPDPATSATACERAGGRRAHPLRASLWHGAEDSVVNPSNLDALAEMLASLEGARPGLNTARADAIRSIYQDARGNPLIERWLVTAMGHAWSGGDPRGSHTFPGGPDATAAMLDFLLPRPAAGK